MRQNLGVNSLSKPQKLFHILPNFKTSSSQHSLHPLDTDTGARTAWFAQGGSADASVDPSSQISTTAVRDQLLLVLGYENKFNIPRDIPTDPLLENEH